MDLTIKEIKEKQKILEQELKDLLNKFRSETNITPTGSIDFGYILENGVYKYTYHIKFDYPNPFS